MKKEERVKTCLIADDSRVVRKVAGRIMDKLGFHISEAEDGMQALAMCEKAFPDVILLDWHMPVMNGMEFLARLRALPGGNAPVVIFCTTENDSDHIAQALAAGANEYVMKPFDEDILSIKLEEAGIV